jgi:hypothetical protein
MTDNKIHVIPYIDQPKLFWDRLFGGYSSYIKEVYFPMQSDIIGSGRPVQPTEHLLKFIENDTIPKSVLINPIVLPRPIDDIAEEILHYLKGLISRHNIIGVSVANLSLARLIKAEFPKIEITASTLMDIFTVQQVLMLDRSVDVIVPSSRIIRDIMRLQELRASFKGKIRLLVNESCLPDCLYRTQHFFEMSDFTNKHPESLCNKLLNQFPWMTLTGSWILPQHLHFFDGIYDELKFAGRVTLKNSNDYIEVLENYFFRRKINNNKIGGGPASIPDDISITDAFYEHTLHCNKKCDECTVCREYWKANT